MSLTPDIQELKARARADLRIGLPVAICDGQEGSGATGALVLAAEVVTAERLADLRALGGAPHLALTRRRAETLRAHVYDGDVARILLPEDAGPKWIASLADPAGDLAAPLRGPLRSARGGGATLSRAAIRLAKEARLLPAALVLERPAEEVRALAEAERLTLLPAATLLSTEMPALRPVSRAIVPLLGAESTRLHIFRPADGGEEHYAVEVGTPSRDAPVLARLHSACFTGDLLGSLKCDCGPQLRAAIAQMGAEGAGVLLYLNQEGRGIGLANKMRAYALQDQGFDTVEANHRLGFEDDERDFRLGAEILRQLGFGAVRLMTNNPAKVARMEESGLTVTERVPLQVGRNPLNTHYLDTKAKKSGHVL
ncbi:GTP cyclohydrolase II [Pseudoroseicyclus tamaricis]|uniref:GTP cyclohydrolase-2 n=1 Tax=Pseudoroseicyclus tamaricis TaxID=2705421 RepID=A0A6B2K411_9RHOB|nr:GTP cyclohydrolase II [Pseudoroseicyclus tamaricis]NDV02562.1 GTP cyclohydrolase II [Pseudoroseicyclus tamaricis]